jgi:hypothetical protein
MEATLRDWGKEHCCLLGLLSLLLTLFGRSVDLWIEMKLNPLYAAILFYLFHPRCSPSSSSCLAMQAHWHRHQHPCQEHCVHIMLFIWTAVNLQLWYALALGLLFWAPVVVLFPILWFLIPLGTREVSLGMVWIGRVLCFGFVEICLSGLRGSGVWDKMGKVLGRLFLWSNAVFIPWMLTHEGMHALVGNGVTSSFRKRAGCVIKEGCLQTFDDLFNLLNIGGDFTRMTPRLSTDLPFVLFAPFSQLEATLLRKHAADKLSEWNFVTASLEFISKLVNAPPLIMESGTHRSPKERPA